MKNILKITGFHLWLSNIHFHTGLFLLALLLFCGKAHGEHYGYHHDSNSYSIPEKGTAVSKTLSDSPDAYEEDNNYYQANLIEPWDEPQQHNFHFPGDQDWVWFNINAPGITTRKCIRAENLGTNCDIIIEIYDTDGKTKLNEKNDGGIGEDEELCWDFYPIIHYVRIKECHGNYGENTEYDLGVFVESSYGPSGESGFVGGRITDVNSGDYIPYANVVSREMVNEQGAKTVANGTYLMEHPEGTFSFTAEQSGYISSTLSGVKIDQYELTTLDFALTPLVPSTPMLPDIKTNGQQGPIIVSSGTSVSVTISLNPGDCVNQKADWWIGVITSLDPPLDYLTYVYPTGWQQGINLCVQSPLVTLPSFEVFNMALPVGTYTFFFALDDPDGIPAGPWLGLDSVEVTVQ